MTWCARLQGHSKAGHVSIVMSFRPHCASSPLQLVVGSGGPQGKGWPCRAVTGLQESGTLGEPEAEAGGAGSSAGGHIMHSTITGQPVASGSAARASAHSGVHA
jgi:hypothetical protein